GRDLRVTKSGVTKREGGVAESIKMPSLLGGTGLITRRRALVGSAAALGVAAGPWRVAIGQAKKPYRIGTEQPMTGVAALGGKTAVIGVQMAVDRINRAGGILGRQVELIV